MVKAYNFQIETTLPDGQTHSIRGMAIEVRVSESSESPSFIGYKYGEPVYESSGHVHWTIEIDGEGELEREQPNKPA